MTGLPEWGFLIAAGILAGIIGTAGGITSLVAYPSLLVVGVGPLAANLTNSIALLGSGASSSARSRRDLHGHGPTFRRWLPQTVLLSAAGAVLLLTTPAGVFNDVVPFLIATGSLILLVQPWISRWQERRDKQMGVVLSSLAGGAVALYNGYFGAGSGILMIALMLFTTEPVLHKANSLKNVILLSADLVPAVLFILDGRVAWGAVWPLGIGAVIGGLIGPAVARRVPHDVLRVLIGCCGLILAVWLLIDL